MRSLSFLLCCLTIVVSPVFADSPRAVDATQFDIAGVKLGMTKNEAVTAITQKLHLEKNAIKFESSPQLNIVNNTKEPRYFSVKAGLNSVSVHFEPNVPYDKNRPLAVSLIIYEQPWTPDNASSMANAALEKYGQLSNGTNGNTNIALSWAWCLEPSSNLGIGCSFYQSKGAVLSLSSTSLKLSDIRYSQARAEFMNKKQAAKAVF